MTSNDDRNLDALLDSNARVLTARLEKLATDYRLLDLDNELEEIKKGLRDEDKPGVLSDLGRAVFRFRSKYLKD